MKEIKSGKDLYLYRYQDYEDPTFIEAIQTHEADLDKQAEEYNFLYNTEFEGEAFARKMKKNGQMK